MYTIFLKNGDCFGYTDMYINKIEVDFWYNHFEKCGYSKNEILVIDLSNEFKKLDNNFFKKECSTEKG